METCYIYEIRIEGELSDRWSDWFEGLSLQYDPCGETILKGAVPDQSALFGVLAKIHGLNLNLISISRFPISQRDETSHPF